MSYILDALRKSELERQMLAGQSPSAPSLLQIKKNGKPRLISRLVILVGLVGFGLILWILLPPLLFNKTNIGLNPDTGVTQALPESVQHQKMATEILPEHIVRGIDLSHQNPDEQPKTIFKVPHRRRDHPVLSAPSPLPDAAQNPSKPGENVHETGPENNAVAKGDPLKDLPPMDIAGYVHTEQGVSIAMINNRLIREGDEIYPGLRLVKILDDKAIFNYKGYIFTR